MTRHLSSEEISQRAAGEYDQAVEQHLNDCSTCRAELALFMKSLSLFRESVHVWAGQQCPSETATIRRIRQAPYRTMLNAFCVAALILFACFAGWSTRPHAPAPVALQSGESDTALLERVNAEVTQTVPTSLAPLRSFVAWETR